MTVLSKNIIHYWKLSKLQSTHTLNTYNLGFYRYLLRTYYSTTMS